MSDDSTFEVGISELKGGVLDLCCAIRNPQGQRSSVTRAVAMAVLEGMTAWQRQEMLVELFNEGLMRLAGDNLVPSVRQAAERASNLLALIVSVSEPAPPLWVESTPEEATYKGINFMVYRGWVYGWCSVASQSPTGKPSWIRTSKLPQAPDKKA